MEKKSEVLHALRIRKIINDTIHNFYKPPKKYVRGDPNDEYGEEAPGASFAEKAKSTMMSGNKTGGGQNQS